MTKKIYILLIIMLGVALIPSDTFACGSKSGKSCCKTENVESHSTKKSAAKACCSKGKKGIKDNESCGGKCGDKSCQCPVFNYSPLVPSFHSLEIKNHFFPTDKQNLTYLETNISSGFYSIWTPPNIG